MTRIGLLGVQTPLPSMQDSLDLLVGAISQGLGAGVADILIAPEYFFSKKPYRVLTEGMKDQLLARLQELSAGSEMVLIPGSVVYGKLIEYEGHTYSDDGKCEYLGRGLVSFTNFANAAPIISSGKLLAFPEKGRARSMDKSHSMDTEDEEASGKNFCHFYSNGVLADDFYSLTQKEELGLNSLEKYLRRRTVSVNGKTMVLEICDDHPLSVDEIKSSKYLIPTFADFQIIVSNEFYNHFITAPENLYLKEGGVLVECNGRKSWGYVAQLVKGRLETLFDGQIPEGRVEIVEVLG